MGNRDKEVPSDLRRRLTTRASLLSCPARCSPPPPCPAAFLPHWTDFPLPTVPILSPSCPSLLSPPHPGAGSPLYDLSLAILTQHIGLCSSREPRPCLSALLSHLLAGWLRVWAPHFPPLCQVLPGGPAALLHGGLWDRRCHLSQGEGPCLQSPPKGRGWVADRSGLFLGFFSIPPIFS